MGRAQAIELAKRGMEIAVVRRERERVEGVATEAQAAAGDASVHTHPADLTLMAGGPAGGRPSWSVGGGGR